MKKKLSSIEDVIVSIQENLGYYFIVNLSVYRKVMQLSGQGFLKQDGGIGFIENPIRYIKRKPYIKNVYKIVL